MLSTITSSVNSEDRLHHKMTFFSTHHSQTVLLSVDFPQPWGNCSASVLWPSPFLNLQTVLCPHTVQFKGFYSTAPLITYHSASHCLRASSHHFSVFNFPLPLFIFYSLWPTQSHCVSRAACSPCVNAVSNNPSLCAFVQVCVCVCWTALRWVSGVHNYLCKTDSDRASSPQKSFPSITL